MATGAIDRVAFIALDNLTGDPTQAWLSQAVPTAAGEQLTGVGKIVPTRVDSSREAYNVAAKRLVNGYFDRRGKQLHFEFSIEDLSTHRIDAVAFDGDLIQVAGQLAKHIDPGAKPFSTDNPQAAEAWGRHDFTKATSLDPDFGAAWRELIQNLAATGKGEAATDAASRALARPSLRSPIDRQNIELALATLKKDEAGIVSATSGLLKLIPNDTSLVETLAQRASSAKDYPEAARLYRELLRLNPDNLLLHNTLGYALFFAGDLAGARKEFQEYAKAPGQEANALDSEGEVLFMSGQFAEAERLFLQSHAKNPDLTEGGGLLKAAHAHWLAGDLAGADPVFAKYLKYRSDHGDKSTEWRHANWEYATGREAQARARLEALSGGPLAELAHSQLLVWSNINNLQSNVAELEKSYRAASPPGDGLVRTLYARALVAEGKQEEARKLIQIWPLPDTSQPLLQGMLYPLFIPLHDKLK